MQLQPAALLRQRDCGAELLARAALFKERHIDQLNDDPSVLYGFNAAGNLDQLSSGDFRSAKGRAAACFMADNRNIESPWKTKHMCGVSQYEATSASACLPTRERPS